MAVNGEGIFGTRVWKTCGEGPTQFEHKTAVDENPTEWQPALADESAVAWQPGDIRYTCKASTIYAFLMRWPGDLAILRSLALGQEQVQSVTLLGYGSLSFRQTGAGLLVDLPAGFGSHVPCLKIETR